MGSVQPSPRGGDGFSTPTVHSNQRRKQHGTSALEEMRAQALAVHEAASKASVKPANLTDDLLNL